MLMTVLAEFETAKNEVGRVIRYKFAFRWCEEQVSSTLSSILILYTDLLTCERDLHGGGVLQMRLVESPRHLAVTRSKEAVFLVCYPSDRSARPGFHFERRNCVRERFFPKTVCLVHFLDSRITCVVCRRNQLCKR